MKILIGLFCVVTVLSVGSKALGTDYLMGSLGDSITAGSFADGSAIDSSSDVDSDNVSSPDGVLTPLYRIPFLGETDNRTTYSWATGEDIRSQFLMLRDDLSAGDTLTAANAAVLGAKADSLEEQAQQIVDEMSSGKYASLKYVTLMIGANDVCNKNYVGGTPDDQMQASIQGALEKLAAIQQTEPIRILVSSIPKIPDLGTDEFKSLVTVNGVTCSTIRNITHACPTMLNWETQDEYNSLVDQVAEKNVLLQSIVKAANQEHSNLQVVYSNTFFSTPLQTTYLAKDCFHPNEVGQTTLAADLWKDQPWFK